MVSRILVAGSAALALAIIVVAVVVLGLPTGGNNGTTCSKCFQTEPIVDIISPSLGNATRSVNENRTIDVQAGTSSVIEIDVYPTIAVNVTLGFTSVLANPSGTATSPGLLPGAAYQPTSLSIAENGKGVSMMTITVPATAVKGTYDSVVTAVNDQNTSEYWGLYFQLVVQ